MSHNSVDKLRVRKLAQRLKQAGLRVWFDEWNIQPGDDIFLAIERGLEVSRTLVLCLSPAALGSDWVSLERSTVLFRDPTNASRRLIPLLLADCKLPDTLRRYKYVDYREEAEEAFSILLATFQPTSPEVLSLPPPATKDKLQGGNQAEQTKISEFQQGFADYIYGALQGGYPMPDLGAGRRILIVDDEMFLLEMLETAILLSYPNLEVIKATDGVRALNVFERGAFAVVITDIVMPGIYGFDLAERMLASDPDIVVIAMSGFFGEGKEIAHFYEVGGFRFHQKPFLPETLLETLGMALNGHLPRLFRSLNLICQTPGILLQHLQNISDSVHVILSYAKKEGHIAHSLLRHKLKHALADFLKSVGTENDIVDKAHAFNMQAKSLCRLAWMTAKASDSAFPSFLRQYVRDLKREHPGLKVSLQMESNVDEVIRGCSAETILALVACELLDNAINAVSSKGRISMDVAHLQSTKQLSIVVQDNGPGVAPANCGRLFQQGFSTKGEGHGLGLHLVQEAVRQFRGKVTYKTLKGACFSVVIPIDATT
jgi:signal transduction histidine kinase